MGFGVFDIAEAKLSKQKYFVYYLMISIEIQIAGTSTILLRTESCL